MKYYVEFPIKVDCNLECPYCFHSGRTTDEYKAKLASGEYSTDRGFTIAQWNQWRDLHLGNATEIIVHFAGGEPFHPANVPLWTEFLESTSVERFDMLSNGLGNRQDYALLLKYRERLDRIGLTYHRKVIHGNQALVERYHSTVEFLHHAGLPVYVKELLFVDEREAIKANRAYWEGKGIPFKIQDFKGWDRGFSGEEWAKYTPEDEALISEEYKHVGRYCSCRAKYRSFVIRGHEWMNGDVLACWRDPKVIGNIGDMTFNPAYKILKDHEAGRMEVLGVPAVYKGTYARDLYTPGKMDHTDTEPSTPPCAGVDQPGAPTLSAGAATVAHAEY